MVFSSIVQQQLEYRREKKLDLNAPLMSVRRQQLRIQLQQSQAQQQQQQQQQSYGYGDEQGDDEDGAWLRSPGAVPFVWERTPGRPKSAHLESICLAPVACASPPLPPGRTMTWTGAEVSTGADSRNSVADLKSNHRPKKNRLLKESSPPHRKHRQASLAELLARKNNKEERPSSASSASEEQQQQHQSPNLMADPPRVRPSWDDPAARDFILKRFLPAAKAMADESASSSPFSSPLVSSASNQQPHVNSRTTLSSSSPSTSSPRKQVSASVERIQTYQYKFASGSRGVEKNEKHSDSHDDVFALKACGFFSFNFAAALRHLRPQYPSSRLKRASDRANNRFATDDFHTSMLVKRVNGGLTIKHEGELSETEAEDDPRGQLPKKHGLLKSPRRLLKSPMNQELFYDCDTNFEPVVEQQKPKTPGRSYYRGSMSPLTEKNGNTKGFLGLPENYTPPEDPYRNGGYSPSIHQKSRTGAELETERNASSLAMMNARNQSSLAQRLSRPVRANADGSNLGSSPGSESRNGVANVSWNSTYSHAVSYGEGSSPSKEQHRRSWQGADLEKTSGMEQVRSPARANFPASPVSSLLPPKSPSQSWLWKALPLTQPVELKETSANWEATVKSRQLRPDHLRYSEENALESCQY